MALLWSQLPAESRTARLQSPSLRWGVTDYLLWKVEFHLREILWSLSYDKKNQKPYPQPLQTPAQTAEAHRRRDNALAARDEIDAILGLGAEDG